MLIELSTSGGARRRRTQGTLWVPILAPLPLLLCWRPCSRPAAAAIAHALCCPSPCRPQQCIHQQAGRQAAPTAGVRVQPGGMSHVQVGGVPSSASPGELRELFEQCGAVRQLVCLFEVGAAEGSALVAFADAAAAQEAADLLDSYPLGTLAAGGAGGCWVGPMPCPRVSAVWVSTAAGGTLPQGVPGGCWWQAHDRTALPRTSPALAIGSARQALKCPPLCSLLAAGEP